MQTIRNPLNIFRARSRDRSEKSESSSTSSKKVKSSPTVPCKNNETAKNNNEKKNASTQKLFMKYDKSARECLAETRIEKKSFCREKTQKSIILEHPMVCCSEKVEKTIKLPDKMMSKKCSEWCYVPGPQPGPSTQKNERPSSSQKNSSEQIIDEIFAPLKKTINENIQKSRFSSSPEKVKSINHTPSSRLEQWKAQLSSNGSRSRDHSAPAPIQRLTIKPKSSQQSLPRPLHSTRSANNALQTMDHRTLRDVNSRCRSGTWQPNSATLERIPPVDFVTSPKPIQNDANIFRPIAYKPKPLENINHNDSNTHSFKRLEQIGRRESRDSNCSLTDLLQMYNSRDMTASFRSNASDSFSFPLLPAEQTSSHNNNNNGHKKVRTTMSSSSSGIHVTPSPSDSGIIDYEHIIRDKEQELQEIRSIMEKNEEIIIKVYHEKERAWKTELEGLSCRVLAAEKGEKALREQLANCQRQNSAMSTCLRTIQEEKTKLNAKCLQLEKEIAYLRNNSICSHCSASNRHNNEEQDLRQEVRDLRREVANLKKVVDDGINYKS